MSEPEVIVGIGGAAGDGTASAGNTLVLSMARQGIAGYSYNSYQSVIRGGHSWLRLRFSAQKPLNHGDQVTVLIALNQDSLDRHLQELPSGGVCLYNGAKFQPSYDPPAGVQLCGLPVPDLAPDSVKLPVMQNTVAVGAAVQLMGLGFETLASVFETTFAKKPSPRSRRSSRRTSRRRGMATTTPPGTSSRSTPHSIRPTSSGRSPQATTSWQWAPPWPGASSTPPTR